jgi:anti-sigma factor RsiW
MNHQGIEDSDRLEAYVTGRLKPEESTEIEVHLVDCPQCLARVEAVQGLLGGFHALGDELGAVPVRAARPPWVRRAAVALAALAAVAVAVAWGAGRERRLERALETERAAVASARQESSALSARLSAAEAARAPLPSPPVASRGPVPVLSLLATRGTDLPRLALPPAGTPVVLLVERESPPRFGHYRVTLTGPGGATVVQEDLAPSSRDVVAVALDPALLRPGLHVLTLQGMSGRGGLAPVGRHRFEVAPVR